MGRNYWCEFCNRGFADILSIRKKHLKSNQHIRLKKLCYDSFKDAATILQEESAKNPCSRFFKTGHCDFGDNCRYSHKDVNQLKRETANNNGAVAIDLDKINSWVDKWKKNHKDIYNEEKPSYRLPSGFPPVQQLPISLQPPLDNVSFPPQNWL